MQDVLLDQSVLATYNSTDSWSDTNLNNRSRFLIIKDWLIPIANDANATSYPAQTVINQPVANTIDFCCANVFIDENDINLGNLESWYQATPGSNTDADMVTGRFYVGIMGPSTVTTANYQFKFHYKFRLFFGDSLSSEDIRTLNPRRNIADHQGNASVELKRINVPGGLLLNGVTAFTPSANAPYSLQTNQFQLYTNAACTTIPLNVMSPGFLYYQRIGMETHLQWIELRAQIVCPSISTSGATVDGCRITLVLDKVPSGAATGVSFTTLFGGYGTASTTSPGTYFFSFQNIDYAAKYVILDDIIKMFPANTATAAINSQSWNMTDFNNYGKLGLIHRKIDMRGYHTQYNNTSANISDFSSIQEGGIGLLLAGLASNSIYSLTWNSSVYVLD